MSSSSLKGFTLIEMLVVVALLGIIAALAVPNFGPMLDREELNAATKTTAGFIAQARMRAIADRRCVRVRITGGNTLIAEVLNTYDCEDPVNAIAATGGTGIDGTGNTWLAAERRVLSVPETTVAITSSGEAPAGEIRFRPNGRLWSNDTNLADDQSRLRITHSALPAGSNFRDIGIFSQGTIRVTGVGVATTVTGQNLS